MPAARTALSALALAAGLLVAGCGDDEPTGASATGTPTSATPGTSEPPPPTTPSPPPSPGPAPGTTIVTGDSEFGVMLFDGNGQAIYLFDRERPNSPDCYDECAAAWPPVLTDGTPQADGAADSALLGTTQRRDGTVQVTYAGHPLYTYANEGPGEVLCHDVFLNGGWWYVITPEGGPGPV
ncbi:COG4315 family predicted lipoprotein [Trujillonella endophytica]|uniref:Predicted lipoprotein with conserved Yx(FWY)xxD motif n=1 Tax=Trujillonella endophytica TaxID=673521 RepID=A0A1H8T0N3_9ACTN|nr:hypothetical protein [Trujillella endophytica]SEO84467.1 Predicted lipoprotein with conserved Yx(FWY)xxD motif [Trujillella endophytica]